MLVLSTSGSRRLIFFLLFVVFGAAMLFGFDPSRDIGGTRLIGTILYGVVMSVLLGVIAWSKEVRFDAETGRVETAYKLFGFEIRQDASIPFYQIRSVVIQKVQLLRDRDVPMKKSGTLGGLIEARSHLYRLFLETGEDRLKLDEGNFLEQLTDGGKLIAEFIDVELNTEEI